MNDDHRPSSDDAQSLAERVGSRMFESDRASRALGMTIERIGPGRATLAMAVRDDMVNGHAICHGGFIFALADSAFAFACNSYNFNTVAQGCSIEYLAPACEGDVLTADAQERSLSGRTGVYDIEVSNQRGETIALFRGKSYRIKGHIVENWHRGAYDAGEKTRARRSRTDRNRQPRRIDGVAARAASRVAAARL